MKLPEEFLKELSEKLSQMPFPGDDIKANTQALLQSALSKLDLVTKDEFDIQTRVLERTREKVEQLESVVAELEQQIKDITKEQ